MRKQAQAWVMVFFLSVASLVVFIWDSNHSKTLTIWERDLDFQKLNISNETGCPNGCNFVPNYIHYISFGGKPITFIELICILSALKNHNPEKFFFHNDNTTTFSGKYWEVLERTPSFLQKVVFRHIELPKEIFGQPLNKNWRKWHGSDIARYRVIMQYGGIYLDADCYVVQSLNKYRKYEATIAWDWNRYMGSQVLIAHKDARFLRKYLDTYKTYDKTKWYYNAGMKPTDEVLNVHPELVHRVPVLFGQDLKYGPKVFNSLWRGWKNMEIIHLLARHQYMFRSQNMVAKYPIQFNETNIVLYPVSFREMVYDLYDIANIEWSKEMF